MSFKYSFLIILMIFILTIVGGVYANEISDDMENSTVVGEISVVEEVDNDLKVSNDEAVLNEGEGTFSQLQSQIDAAQESATLNLTRDFTYTPGVDSGSEGIIINKNITINGNGFTINAVNQTGIFHISADNVVLNNIKFTNGNSAEGGAIYFDGGDLTISGCEFINMTAPFVNEKIDNGWGNFSLKKYLGTSILYINSSNNVVISKSKFYSSRFSDYAIKIDNSSSVVFDGNAFENNIVMFDEAKYNSTTGEYGPFSHYCGYKISTGRCESNLINVKANKVSFTNSIFVSNTLKSLIKIISDDADIKNLNVSDSHLCEVLDVRYINFGDNCVSVVENVNIHDINASMESSQWNDNYNEYCSIISTPGGKLVKIDGNIVNVADFNVSNIYGSGGVLDINSNNFTGDSIIVNGFYPYDYETIWDEANKCYYAANRLESESLINIFSCYSAIVNDIHINGAFVEEGNALDIYAAYDVCLTNSSFTNIVGGEKIVHIPASGDEAIVMVDNVTFKNNSIIFNETYWDSEKKAYYWKESTYFEASQLWISSYSLSLSNILIDNVTCEVSEDGIVSVFSSVANVSNISILDSSVWGGEGGCSIYIDVYDNLTLENILVDNIEVIAWYITEYYADYDEYITTYSVYGASPGIWIDNGKNIYLNNIVISNSQSSTEEANRIYSQGNVTINDFFLINLTQKIIEDYSYLNGGFSYSAVSGESSNGIYISGKSIEISNFGVNNVESGKYDFIYVEAYDKVNVENMSIMDSAIGTNGVIIQADEVKLNNFVAKNIMSCPYNSTEINPDGSYDYIYYSSRNSYSGSLIYLYDCTNVNVSNIYVSNIFASYNGVLNVQVMNINVSNVTFENISSPVYSSLENSSSEGVKFSAQKTQSSVCMNIGGDNEVSLSNIKLKDVVAGEQFIYASGENITVNNFTVVNAEMAIGKYTSNYEHFKNGIYDDIYESAEELIYFYAQDQLIVSNLMIDGLPGTSDSTITIGGANIITLTNSTFRNIEACQKEEIYDENSNEYNVTYYSNVGEIIIIEGQNAYIENTVFENIQFGSNDNGAVIISSNNATLENCTFRNINSSYEAWYLDNHRNITIDYDTYGSAISLNEESSATINNSRFINCHADYGGAISLTASMNIAGSSFINCSATYDGGALYFNTQSLMNNITGTEFIKNIAARNGGAIYIYESEDGVNLIRDSTFIANHANYNGGAFFYNNTGDMKMFEDYRWYNRTIMFNDDLRELNEVNSKILNSKFENNTDYEFKILAFDSIRGENQSLTVTLPEDADGPVFVNVTDWKGTVIKTLNASSTDGVATFNLGQLQTGKYNVLAYYSSYEYESAPYYYHEDSTLFSVRDILNANVTAKNVTEDENTNFTIEVPSNFTGNVSIVVDGEVIYNGTVNSTIIADKLGPGSKTANVTFYGDDNYVQESKLVNFTVEKLIPSIEAIDMTRGWNSPYDYQAVFYDKKHNPLANTEVIFNVDGKNYTVKTDDNGLAQLTSSKLAIGEYVITLINNVTGENATAKLSIVKRLIENKDLTLYYRDGSKWDVRAIGDDGNPVGKGEIVVITTHGISYKCMTDKNGYARLRIELLPKSYPITAEYKDYKVTNKLKVIQTLKPVKKTIKVKKSAKSFKIKASLKQGKKPVKGQKIVFKIKGKKYSAKTNKKGIATVKVKKNIIKKLKKGKKYKVTITYSLNYTYSNKIANNRVKCYVLLK
ncbi:hypothetical protein [Methanobrevibacter sp.]